MELTSPIEDHEPAYAYACYLTDVKGKEWSDVYVGARWELTLAAYLGVRDECAMHLARVEHAVIDDFEFDFLVRGLKVDAKATMSPPGRRNNLIVTRSRLRGDIAYVLGDLRARRKPSRDDPGYALTFDAVGWSMGTAALFRQCYFPRMSHAVMRNVSELSSVTELRKRAMGTHIIGGVFKSDKYEWSPPGFVPLKLTDPMAWDPLWAYAQARRSVDSEFSDDLEAALVTAGFVPACADCGAPATRRYERTLGHTKVICADCHAGSWHAEPIVPHSGEGG